LTILEFAQMINLIVGNKAGIVYKSADRLESDPQRRRPDVTRARTILGWEPKISLDNGIHKTIPYFRKKLGLE
jgi:dTDP-glucose 4,6-dehydratase